MMILKNGENRIDCSNGILPGLVKLSLILSLCTLFSCVGSNINSDDPDAPETTSKNDPDSPTQNLPSAIDAANIYTNQCASCHGDNGTTPFGANQQSLSDLTRTRSEVANAVARMPAGQPACAGDPECANSLTDYLLTNFIRQQQDHQEVCVDDTVPPVTTQLARISHAQYDYIVEDLLGQNFQVATNLRGDAVVSTHFDTAFQDFLVDSRLHIDYQSAAETLAQTAVQNHWNAISDCNNVANCREASLQKLANALFRRSLTNTELNRYETLFDAAAGNAFYQTGDNNQKGMRIVVEAMLQSPHFIYRQELDVENDVLAGTSVERLTALQIASRISFLLWQSGPDAALLDAAQNGQLETEADISQQVSRMMASNKFYRAFDSFHAQVMDTDKFAEQAKQNPLPRGAKESMQEEVRLFTRSVLNANNGTYAELMTANYTFANNDIAELYALDGNFSDDFEYVELPAGERAGLLTQSGLMSSHASALTSSPITRGTFALENLLCDTVNSPPFQITIPDVDTENLITGRQYVEAITADATCQGCHDRINPIGFAFEHYDERGAFREVDNGEFIDASGILVTLSGERFEFQNAVEFAQQLATSRSGPMCYLENWFTYSYGREPETSDSCALSQADARLQENGYDLQQVVRELTTLNTFRYRRSER